MSEPDYRIGDKEREQALEALGEHLGAGYLDIDEYGERTARVSAAKTRRELLGLFADLPEPRPRFGQVPPAVPQPVVPKPAAGPPVSRRLVSAVVPLVGLLCVLLFFVSPLKSPLVFLLIPVAAVLIGTLIGDERRKRQR